VGRSFTKRLVRLTKSGVITKKLGSGAVWLEPGEALNSISSQTLHGKSSEGEDAGQITGYSLRQELEVRSTDVDRIAKIAREATELINQGILIELTKSLTLA
jgi:hypothetical protein